MYRLFEGFTGGISSKSNLVLTGAWVDLLGARLLGGLLRNDLDVLHREAHELSNHFAHTVFIKSFCKSQFPHKSVNLSFIITRMKNKLTDLCGY